MSRIFDALKNAQAARDKRTAALSQSSPPVEIPDRRSSRRLAFDVPVYVYGHADGKPPFREEAHTLQVSSNGALLLLGGPVEPGDKLLLTHAITQSEQDCVVVYLGKKHQITTEVGITFAEPNPSFWQVRIEQWKKASA